MQKPLDPHRLDVLRFATQGGSLNSSAQLAAYSRLLLETGGQGGDFPVEWRADGVLKPASSGALQPWLHLQAQAVMPLMCQRCLGRLDITVKVDRWFRFESDETTAAREDEEAHDEDVLALGRDLDVVALAEDELLMDMPLVPRHAVCPEPLASPAEAAAETQPPAKPFAVLAKLRSGES